MVTTQSQMRNFKGKRNKGDRNKTTKKSCSIRMARYTFIGMGVFTFMMLIPIERV